MRKVSFAVIAFMLVMVTAAAAEQMIRVDRPMDIPSFVGYVQDEFIVVFKEDVGQVNAKMTSRGIAATGVVDFDAISERFSASRLTKQFPTAEAGVLSPSRELAKYYTIKIEDGTLDEAMEAFRAHPMVESVEPIGIHTMSATPNDGFYSQQWHLNRANDADMDAPEAWDIETGSPNVIVAILDSGVRYYHKDLGGSNASSSNPTGTDGNMWINTLEKNGTTGVDDDGNGFVDDWVGWDWVTGVTGCWSGEDCSTADNDPRDFNGHGTHCAGNVGAINNNGYASCSPSGGWGTGAQQPTGNGVKVMACRIGYSGNYLGQEAGFVRMDFAASAFYYAANNGARVASCSWGSSNSGGIAAALDYFIAQGGLVFHAAGNDGSQTADYLGSRTDVINVAATDSNDCKANFSTYGTWVDISAPGTGILSAYHVHSDPANDYVATLDGTSMATPLAASVAGLIWSQNNAWTASQVRTQLYASADDIYGLSCNGSYGGRLGAGRVNAYNAVNTGCTPPVANFAGSPTSGTAPLTVNFTDQSTGNPSSWSWDFGDGGNSTSQNPSYQYTTAGTYTVTLNVTNACGSDGETKVNYVTVNPCTAPVAAFVGSPTSGTAPLTVNFTDQSTNATSWSWNFGDAGTSTAQNPSHQYAAAGNYTVTLTVTNACGSDNEIKTNYITVSEPTTSCDDFADGNFTGWTITSGTWTASAGYLKGNSTALNTVIRSPFGTFTSFTIDADVRMNTGQNQRKARIIFAWQNSTNYRYIEGDDAQNRWRIFEVVNGSHSRRRNISSSISTGVWYDVTVTSTSGGLVTLVVNGNTITSWQFASGGINGQAGCGYNRSNSDFDNFCVSSSLSVFAGAGEEALAKTESGLPETFGLRQNYPNPFNPSTTIGFSLPAAGYARLEIFNIVGQRVDVLADGYFEAGEHELQWEASNYSSGVYLYRLQSENMVDTKKMLLLK